MPLNRRSLYRLLHVQPDAPVEIIRAAYRVMMSTLRHHPDLGGDHDMAALLNEAHAVLTDPARRAAYDAARDMARDAARGARGPAGGTAARPERADRRGMPRVSKSDWAILRRVHGDDITETDGVDIRLRDLSLAGIGFYCGAALSAGARVRITGRVIDVTADVVSCRRSGGVFVAHASLVTARFATPSGVFVSMTA